MSDASTTVDISGDCAARFGAVKDAFAANFDDNGDVGASVAVAIAGRAGRRPVGRSPGRGRDHAVAARHDHQRVLDDEDDELPVAARARQPGPGRRRRAGREVLARVRRRTARATCWCATCCRTPPACPAWEQRIEGTDLYDWDKVTGLLAEQATWWEPGSKSGYHGVTQGNLVGEVVRRVDGRSVGTFFADEIAGPLGADFHIGLGAEHDHRVAPGHPGPAARLRQRPTASRARPRLDPVPRREPAPAWPSSRGRSRGGAPRSPPPAATATPAAWRSRSAAVSHGGSARGVDLLSTATIDRIFDVQAAGRDLVLGIGVTFGVGYGLNSPRNPISPNARVCYWGGWGGSLVVNDVDAGFTMAYVMNRMGEGTVGDDRAHTLLRAMYASLAD